MNTSIAALQVSVEVNGDVATVFLSGELDVFSCPQLLDATWHALRFPVESVVVDASGVTFIDVRGIGGLIQGADEARARGRRFVVRHPSASVVRVHELTRVSDAALPLEPCG
jgi:anti-anti-sigma factor